MSDPDIAFCKSHGTSAFFLKPSQAEDLIALVSRMFSVFGMNTPHDTTGVFAHRIHWARLVVTFVALSLLASVARPAETPDVVYLVARKDSANRTTPLRLIWNQLDASNARLKIDLPPSVMEEFKKAGITPVIDYPAVLENDHFVIRTADFARLVKDFATSLARGLAGMFGGEAKIGTITVHESSIHVTPGPWRMEGYIKLHVTETLPDKPVKNVLSGNLEFVGPLEALDPDDISAMIMNKLGPYIPAARKTGVAPRNQVRLVNEVEFKAAVRKTGLDPDRYPEMMGFTDFSQKPPIIYIRPGAPPATLLHEMIHLYCNPEVQTRLVYGLREGLTNHLAELAGRDVVPGKPNMDLSWAFANPTRVARALVADVGLEAVARAYFGTDTDLAALHAAVDKKRNGSAVLLTLQLYLEKNSYDEALALIGGR